MTDTVEMKLSCGACGGTLQTKEDEPTDDSIVRCASCGKEIGTYGEVIAAAREQAVEKVKDQIGDMFENAFKGNKHVKFRRG